MLILEIKNKYYTLYLDPEKTNSFLVKDLVTDEIVGEWSIQDTPLTDERTYQAVGLCFQTNNPILPTIVQIANSEYEEAIALQIKNNQKPLFDC